MDKSDIFTAELILIFSLVIDISRYFHCRVWITSDVSIHLTSLNVPHFRNSNAYSCITPLFTNENIKCGYSFSYLER